MLLLEIVYCFFLFLECGSMCQHMCVLCVNTEHVRFDCIALRSCPSAAELPAWPSHPEPVGCEHYNTTAVCLPTRTGLVVFSRCEARVVAGEVAASGPVGMQWGTVSGLNYMRK